MKIKQLHKDAILPQYATNGANAFDIYTYKNIEWKRCDGYWTAVIPTGWAFELPPEHGLFILSRSGHGFKFNTHLVNCVGLLDYDYRGELLVKLISFGKQHPNIQKGSAVAQCVVLKTPRIEFDVVDELSETQRGDKGFGSTGI